MTCHQTIVWIDDQEACILRMEDGLERDSTVFARIGQEAILEPVSGDSEDAAPSSTSYFHRVARALDIADEILIVGPSATKLEFAEYMHKSDHAIDPRILGVETIAHPTDTQLAAFAKLYFTVGGPRRSGNGSGHKKAD
jgi:stalled ribosome rescue protein Dom34